MKFRLALGALALLVSTICVAPAWAADPFKGTWSLLPADEPGKVRFGITHRRHGGHSQHESDWALKEFQGLELTPPARRDVAFTISRDAGRFDCEGYLKNGEGAGTFTFTHDAGFVKRMAELGFTGIDENEQFAMAVHDVTVSFASAMKAENLSGLSTDKLIAFRIFEVHPQFIRELRAEGLPAGDADMLIAFRVHNVSPAFVRDIVSLGYARPEADQLVAMRVHDVTPEFITDLRARGLKNLSIDQLINLRVHGIE